MFLFCFCFFAVDLVRDASGVLIKALVLLDLKLRAAVRSEKNNTDCGEAKIFSKHQVAENHQGCNKQVCSFTTRH